MVWNSKPIEDGVELTYLSKDGEEGYPGNLSVAVRYTLSQGALRIEYSATTDKETVVNLTNHAYFNLIGRHHRDILGHQLTLHASRFTPVDSNLIPTGELKPDGAGWQQGERGALDTGRADRRDEIKDADAADAAAPVVEVDSQVAGGLLDVEE